MQNISINGNKLTIPTKYALSIFGSNDYNIEDRYDFVMPNEQQYESLFYFDFVNKLIADNLKGINDIDLLWSIKFIHKNTKLSNPTKISMIDRYLSMVDPVIDDELRLIYEVVTNQEYNDDMEPSIFIYNSSNNIKQTCFMKKCNILPRAGNNSIEISYNDFTLCTNENTILLVIQRNTNIKYEQFINILCLFELLYLFRDSEFKSNEITTGKILDKNLIKLYPNNHPAVMAYKQFMIGIPKLTTTQIIGYYRSL